MLEQKHIKVDYHVVQGRVLRRMLDIDLFIQRIRCDRFTKPLFVRLLENFKYNLNLEKVTNDEVVKRYCI